MHFFFLVVCSWSLTAGHTFALLLVMHRLGNEMIKVIGNRYFSKKKKDREPFLSTFFGTEWPNNTMTWAALLTLAPLWWIKAGGIHYSAVRDTLQCRRRVWWGRRGGSNTAALLVRIGHSMNRVDWSPKIWVSKGNSLSPPPPTPSSAGPVKYDVIGFELCWRWTRWKSTVLIGLEG